MRSSVLVRVTLLLSLLVGAACSGEKKTFDPPDREARVAEAEELFGQTRFDTITWTSDDERALAGNGVYAADCRNCHGTVGEGATEYGESQGLQVPSIVESDWPLAASIDSVRHRVFVGHAAGMPQWGVTGLTIREIDAVAFYVLERLRPEMLNGGG